MAIIHQIAVNVAPSPRPSRRRPFIVNIVAAVAAAAAADAAATWKHLQKTMGYAPIIPSLYLSRDVRKCYLFAGFHRRLPEPLQAMIL